MVRQFEITQGDQLEWSIIALRGQLVMLIKKIGEPLEQNIISHDDIQKKERDRKYF